MSNQTRSQCTRKKQREPFKNEQILLKSTENNDGNVDYSYIEENRDILEQYMDWIGTHGIFSDKMRIENPKKIAFYQCL